VRRREDGLLMVATSADVYLLDPTRFGLASEAGQLHPAIVGIIAGAGSGARSFDGSLAGLQVVNLGQKNAVLQSPPKLSFVTFTNTPFDPAALAGLPAEAVETLLRGARPATAVFQARRQTVPGYINSSLSPPSPLVHAYVLVHAPGSAGANIHLSLASLNAHGRPLPDRGPGFPPVRALEGNTLTNLVGPNAFAPGAAVPGAFPAFRLSSNPTSPLYNVYLSRPFAVVGEGCSSAQLASLQAELPRAVLWAGALVRASLDASLENNPVLGPFCDRSPARGAWLPGVHAVALTLPGDYLMGPNPRAITGNPTVPGTFKTVSAHNGEFNVQTTDFALPGRAMPIVFTRVHRAQDLYEGPFGRGWDFNYNQRLVEHRRETFVTGTQVPVVIRKTARDELATQRDVLFHNGLGRSVVFKFAGTNPPPEYAADPLLDELDWDINGRAFYLPPEGVFDILTRFDDGRFGRLTPDGTQYWYGPDGRLEKICSRYVKRDARNCIELEYNVDGELTRIVDRSVETPHYLRLGYYRFEGAAVGPQDVTTTVAAKVGKIARLEDYTGRDVLFDYNANGEMTHREGIRVVSGHAGAFVNARARTTYMTAPALEQMPFANGLRGLVAGSADAAPLFGASTVGKEDVPVVTGGTGAAVNGPATVTLQQPNQAEEIAKGTAKSITSLPDSSTAEHEFTEEGLTRKVTYKGPRASDAAMSYTYAAGLVASIMYPEGNSVSYLRNLADSLRSRPNVSRVALDPGPRGPGPHGPIPNASWSDYDPKYNYPRGTYRDFNGNLITLEPTADGLDIGRIDYGPAGAVRMTYNDFGQLETVTTIEGFQIQYEYDPQTGFLTGIRRGGTLFTKLEYTGGGGGFAHAGELGLVRKVIPQGAGSAPIERDYNEREELITIRRANKQEELRSYDQNGHLVRISRKLDGSQSYVETREVTQNGFIRSVTVEGAKTGATPQGSTAIALKTTYVPDDLFRITEIRHPDELTVTKFEDYDHLGRYARKRLGDYVEEYNYDLNGNLKSVKRDTATDTFSYDGYDRLHIAELAADGGVERIEREYFGNGELKRLAFRDTSQNTDREENYQVDALGRITLTEVVTGGTPARTRVDYSGGSRVVTITDPAGEITTLTYDAAGRLIETSDSTSTRTYVIDESDRLKRVDSLEAGRTFFNNFEPFNELDQFTRLADKQGLIANLTPRFDGAWQFSDDALNRRTEHAYSSLGEMLTTIEPHGVEFRRSFDALRRLSAEHDQEDQGRAYTFDATGRMTSRILRNGARWVVTDFDRRNNRPKTGTMPGGNFEFSHDAKGRPTSRQLTFAGAARTETMTYDALDRPRRVTFPGGALDFTYFSLGPYRQITHTYPAGSFDVAQTIRNDGVRLSLTYPAPDAVTLTSSDRDVAGRLDSLALEGGDLVVKRTDYAAAELVGTQVLGPDVILCENAYDDRKRLTRRTFTALASTNLLAEVRYAYDPVNNVVARQLAHRHGRTDFFSYDNGDRLTRADRGARPQLPLVSGRPAYTGFSTPAGVSGNWAPGFFGRVYAYRSGGLDLLQSVTEINPDALVPSPFALSYGTTDGFLQITEIDGVSRASDALGHATGSRLWTRPASGPAPVPENASLTYDGFGHLIRVELSSGVTITYGYRHDDLCHTKTVTGPGATEERTFIYDQALLLAEYVRTGSSNVLHGRYYYADTDVPVAADLRGSDGSLRRYYALQDAMGSVIALADAAGNVVERYDYDPWGQPEIELADTNAPRLLRITSTGDGIRLIFSERVLPQLAPTSGDDIIGGYDSLAAPLTLEADGQPVAGQWELDETASGLPFGVAYRFTGSLRNGDACQLALNANRLFDEWGNPVAPLVQAFLFNDAPGTSLFSAANPADTSPARVARSAVGWPFLFQGQYFDYDAGLVYMRARFYDPGTGLFLQPDPNGYEDSVNLYAGLGHNPTSWRDPSGRAVRARWNGRVGANYQKVVDRSPTPQSGAPGSPARVWNENAGAGYQKLYADGEQGRRQATVGRAGSDFDEPTIEMPMVRQFDPKTLSRSPKGTGDARTAERVEAMSRAKLDRYIARRDSLEGNNPLISRVVRYVHGDEEHFVAVAKTSVGNQAFYKRTGKGGASSGAKAGDWVPMDGISPQRIGFIASHPVRGVDDIIPQYPRNWINKHEYTYNVSGELHRFGTQEFRNLGNRIRSLDEAGQLQPTVTITSPKKLNEFIDQYNVRDTLGRRIARELGEVDDE
jgi:RHS repeat-associated protein